MSSDFEDQASGYLAVFTNDNGNVTICPVVFASTQQAQEWAVAVFKNDGFERRKMRVSPEAVTLEFSNGSEMSYRFIPVIQAEADRGADRISLNHIVTIR